MRTNLLEFVTSENDIFESLSFGQENLVDLGHEVVVLAEPADLREVVEVGLRHRSLDVGVVVQGV